jgi:hypothetical protein
MLPIFIIGTVKMFKSSKKNLKTGLIILIVLMGVLMPVKNYYISEETELVEQEFIKEMIKEIAPKYGVEVALVQAIIKQESGGEIFSRRYDYKPLSKQAWFNSAMQRNGFKGKEYYYSAGLCQVLYLVAKLDYGFDGTFYDLFDPKNNIEICCKILSKLSKKYGGDIKKMASAYNAGSDTYGNYRDYAEPVYKMYKDFGGVK